MTHFSGSKVFGCFEKHSKVVSGALRGGFRAREVFGSFEKRTPGLIDSRGFAYFPSKYNVVSISNTNFSISKSLSCGKSQD